jgi:hypothetical protein
VFQDLTDIHRRTDVHPMTDVHPVTGVHPIDMYLQHCKAQRNETRMFGHTEVGDDVCDDDAFGNINRSAIANSLECLVNVKEIYEFLDICHRKWCASDFSVVGEIFYSKCQEACIQSCGNVPTRRH